MAFAACGGGGGPSATATPKPTGTATAAATLGPQAQRPANAQEVQAEVVKPANGVIAVEAQDNNFTTNHFQVGVGEAVVFKVTNKGSNPHTFTIAGVDGQFGTADDITTDTLSSGKEEDLNVALDIAGTYVFRCNVHPTQMWGAIDVGSAGGASSGY